MKGRKGSALGNPYKASNHSIEEHQRVVALYRSWLWTRIKARDNAVCAELKALKAATIAQRYDRPVRIACWCKPLPCHGDVLKACIEWSIASSYEF
jgi:hypothetical protein